MGLRLTTPVFTTQHTWIVLHCFFSVSQTYRLLLTPASIFYLPSWVTPRSLLCFCVASGLTGTWCAVQSCQRRIVNCPWVGLFQSLAKIRYFTLNSRNTNKQSSSLQTAKPIPNCGVFLNVFCFASSNIPAFVSCIFIFSLIFYSLVFFFFILT